MGNRLASQQVAPIEYYLHDVPRFALTSLLGKGRFLKTIQCVHDQGLVVLKVFVKSSPHGEDHDAITEYTSRLAGNATFKDGLV